LFGSDTSKALIAKEHTDSVNEATYNAIILKANPTATKEKTVEQQLKDLAAQYFGKGTTSTEKLYSVLGAKTDVTYVRDKPSSAGNRIANVLKNYYVGITEKEIYDKAKLSDWLPLTTLDGRTLFVVKGDVYVEKSLPLATAKTFIMNSKF
jgi:hypothetical protein